MDKLIMENFRCFAGRHEVPLKPLTVLVGENSSGKSSFLAAVRLAWHSPHWLAPADFNEEPFFLGSFDDIVNESQISKGHPRFSVGGSFASRAGREHRRIGRTLSIDATYGGVAAEPRPESRRLAGNGYEIRTKTLTRGSLSVALTTPTQTRVTPPLRPEWYGANVYGFGDVARRLLMHFARPMVGGLPEEAQEFLGELSETSTGLLEPRPIAFAPVRSKPARTYDPLRDRYSPDGEHVPLRLSQILRSGGESASALASALARFGHDAGMFTDVKVRQFGGTGDPFQILIGSEFGSRNLIDVGYGISQVLPILTELLTAQSGSTFLIQQPEVHLHPRAQASLASLIAKIIRERDVQIIVETHSDHFIDRVRMDVRDGAALNPEDVSLLYFELGKRGSTVSPIRFDEIGNVLDAPVGYRRFFLDEEMRFFGAK